LANQEPNIGKDRKVGSIYIPETVNSVSKIRWGKVVAVGDGTSEMPMEVSVGDRICYINDEGRVTIEGNILMRLNDVLFIDE